MDKDLQRLARIFLKFCDEIFSKVCPKCESKATQSNPDQAYFLLNTLDTSNTYDSDLPLQPLDFLYILVYFTRHAEASKIREAVAALNGRRAQCQQSGTWRSEPLREIRMDFAAPLSKPGRPTSKAEHVTLPPIHLSRGSTASLSPVHDVQDVGNSVRQVTKSLKRKSNGEVDRPVSSRTRSKRQLQ